MLDICFINEAREMLDEEQLDEAVFKDKPGLSTYGRNLDIKLHKQQKMKNQLTAAKVNKALKGDDSGIKTSDEKDALAKAIKKQRLKKGISKTIKDTTANKPAKKTQHSWDKDLERQDEADISTAPDPHKAKASDSEAFAYEPNKRGRMRTLADLIAQLQAAKSEQVRGKIHQRIRKLMGQDVQEHPN